MKIVADTFLLEDVSDPVAVSVFANTDNYDMSNDEELGEELLKFDEDDENEFDDELLDDLCYNTETDIVNSDIDIDYEAENDFDEDGEIIDIIDGTYY